MNFRQKKLALFYIISMFFLFVFFFSAFSQIYASSFTFSPFDGINIETEIDTPEELQFWGIVRKEKDVSCGAASLATILKYCFNEQINEKDILGGYTGNESAQQKEVSLLGLKEVAEKKGYKVYGLKMTLEGLNNVDLPFIALLQYPGYPHFVVIRNVKENEVYLADPLLGNFKIMGQEFQTMWNQIVIAIDGDQQAVKKFRDISFLENRTLQLKNINEFLEVEVPPFVDFLSSNF